MRDILVQGPMSVGVHAIGPRALSAEYRFWSSTEATILEYVTGTSRDVNYFNGIFWKSISLVTYSDANVSICFLLIMNKIICFLHMQLLSASRYRRPNPYPLIFAHALSAIMPWGKCCAHAHNVSNTSSARSMHVVCCMCDTVYYVQIHDTEVRVIDF
jgi:hypothetical protein